MKANSCELCTMAARLNARNAKLILANAFSALATRRTIYSKAK